MNAEIKQKIMKHKLVSIIRGIERDRLFPTVEALYSGGIRCIEITLNTPDALEMIDDLKQRYDTRLLIGAGTVLDQTSAINAFYAGADFVLSPILSFEVIEACHRYSKAVVPGIATPTEAIKAWEEGADILKIFPAAPLGADYIKNMLAPLDKMDIMAVGGITLDNIVSFSQAGAGSFGIGNSLADPTKIASGNYSSIEQQARSYLQILKQ